jgi:FAD/FMN-containing dehydrogenase
VEIHLPGSTGYDIGRAGWNLAVTHEPVAVAVPLSTEGVITVIDHARRSGLSVAIQSTGHGPTRVIRDAVMLNMWRMTDVHLDLDRSTVRIGGGAKWQAVLDVITPHGLAPLLGSTPDVSAVGYTLGGGLGWMARKYGTSADSVVSFEVVTADGRLVVASADENPELFWALRGAGAGHLGVVVSMEVQLYPISQLYAGNLFYPAEMAVDVLRRWRDWIETVPEALTSGVTMLNLPPFEDIPEEMRGRSLISVRGAFDGPMEEGERLLAHWREWRTPYIDAFGPLPFAQIADVSQDPLEPVPCDGTGVWLGSLTDGTIDELAKAAFPPDGDPVLVHTEMRHAGGALARPGTSAFGNRDAKILLEFVGVTFGPDDTARINDLIRDVRSKIAADLTGGVYLNYAELDERRYGVANGIGEAGFARLKEVKRAFDPQNLFDHGLDAS